MPTSSRRECRVTTAVAAIWGSGRTVEDVINGDDPLEIINNKNPLIHERIFGGGKRACKLTAEQVAATLKMTGRESDLMSKVRFAS